MKTAPFLGIFLLGCNQSQTNPVLAAISCVESNVPKGDKVAGVKARAVISGCKSQMEAWSRWNVENRFHRPFDRSDPEMLEAYNLHRKVSTERMLLEITDEMQPTFYVS